MFDSPFSTFTLWQYRNLAMVCLAAGAFFLAVGGSGFQGGVNAGLGLALVASGITFVALRRYVQRRLDWPVEYWRAQQRRVSGRIWGATYAVAAAGVVLLLLALLVGATWLAGCAAGATLFPALLIGGKLTGQVKPI